MIEVVGLIVICAAVFGARYYLREKPESCEAEKNPSCCSRKCGS